MKMLIMIIILVIIIIIIIIIIIKMNTCSYTCLFMFNLLNNAIYVHEILYVIFKYTYWSVGFYVTR